jgi:hypothetical protein
MYTIILQNCILRRGYHTVGGIETVTFPSHPVPFKRKRIPVPFNRKTGIEREADQGYKWCERLREP